VGNEGAATDGGGERPRLRRSPERAREKKKEKKEKKKKMRDTV
jgi:hypothetical protein